MMDTVNSILKSASSIVYGDTTTTESSTTGTSGTTGTTQPKHDSLLGEEGSSTTATTTSDNVTGGQEPLSGQTGAGTAGKPYDAGNTTGEPTNTTSTSDTGATSTAGTGTGSTTGTGTGSTADAGTSSTEDTNLSAPKGEVGKSSATATTAQDVGSAPPESGAAPEAKHQGANKPTDVPDPTESKAISDKKQAADSALADESSSGANAPAAGEDTSGASSGPPAGDAGPKPLGGESDKSGSSQKDELGSKSKEPGTGEKYIKSSGTKADGGDFDASNAGAAKEADRLLEEKGIHHEAGNTGPPEEVPGDKGAAAASGSGEKVKFSQKLKDKLHIKSKDKP